MAPTEMNNLPVLATAVQLIGEIALEIVGNDLASSVGGEKITQQSVNILACSTLNKVLSENSHA